MTRALRVDRQDCKNYPTTFVSHRFDVLIDKFNILKSTQNIVKTYNVYRSLSLIFLKIF